MFGIWRLDVHQNTTFPAGTQLGIVVHGIRNTASVSNVRSVQILPEVATSVYFTFSDQIFETKEHGADYFICDGIFVVEL